MPNKHKYSFAVLGTALLLILIVYLIYDRKIDVMEQKILYQSP